MAILVPVICTSKNILFNSCCLADNLFTETIPSWINKMRKSNRTESCMHKIYKRKSLCVCGTVAQMNPHTIDNKKAKRIIAFSMWLIILFEGEGIRKYPGWRHVFITITSYINVYDLVVIDIVLKMYQYSVLIYWIDQYRNALTTNKMCAFFVEKKKNGRSFEFSVVLIRM